MLSPPEGISKSTAGRKGVYMHMLTWAYVACTGLHRLTWACVGLWGTCNLHFSSPDKFTTKHHPVLHSDDCTQSEPQFSVTFSPPFFIASVLVGVGCSSELRVDTYMST